MTTKSPSNTSAQTINKMNTLADYENEIRAYLYYFKQDETSPCRYDKQISFRLRLIEHTFGSVESNKVVDKYNLTKYGWRKVE